MNQNDDEVPARQEPPPPLWEWVVAGIGLVLVAGSIGFLGWEALSGRSGPPRFQLEVLGIEQQASDRYLVRVRAHNQARQTAAGLQVRGSLLRDGAVVEESETEFDYVPGRSDREGGLYFTRDPRSLQLEVTPRGFRAP